MPAATGSGGSGARRPRERATVTGEPGAAPGVPREERKLVTVLFADLAGYTAIASSLDPEEVYASLRPGILELQRAVEGFGGTVPQILGDGFMAVFGVPVAHEDDAERAVRAALAVRDLARELRAAGGRIPFPDVHAGVNSGEVIVVPAAEAGGFAVIGDTVNSASRLADLAPPGGVLVDRRTRNRTAQAVRYGRGRLLRAKGKPEGLLTYEAVAPIARVPGGRPAGAAPFVDREAELERLDRAFRDAVRAGRSRVTLLVGEAGLGKTRLASELRPRWRARVVGGRCAPFGAREPLQALVLAVTEAVNALPGPGGPESPGRLEGAARRLARGGDPRGLARDLRLLWALADGAPRGSLSEAAAAVRRVVEALAAARPTVVVLDDLQWADPELLQLLVAAGRDPWRGPILLLGLARPGVRLAGVPTLELRPLDATSEEELAARILGHPAPEGVVWALLDRAGGNPFFLVESLAMLVEAGSLQPDGEGWRLGDPRDLLRVPSSVRLLIAARIDGLPEDEKLALREGSVAGERLWDELLARGRPGASTRRALHRLAARGILRRRERSQIPGAAEYEFRHVLFRDVAYQSLARAERARRHLEVAGWLRERAGDLPREPVALIAEHYERAWRLGAGGAGVAEMAASYLRRWADELRTYHPRAGEAVARRGLEVARAGSVGGAEVGRLLASRAEALIEMGRHGEALREAARAARLASGDGDRRALGRALLVRGRALSDRGRIGEARPLLRRARRVFRQAGDLAGEGWATHALSETLAPEDQGRQLRHLLEAHALLSRAGDERGRAVTAQSLAYVLTIRGGRGFRRWHAEARRLGGAEGDRYAEAVALRSWGYFLHYRGDHGAAIAAMRAVRPLAMETGDRYLEADAILIEATSGALVGALDEAEALVAQALELGRAVGSTRIRAMALVAGARAALRGGRPREAWERLRAARRLVRPPTRLEVVDRLAAEAGMLLDAGRLGALPRVAAHLGAGVRAAGWRLWLPLAPLAVGRALLASGDPWEAAGALRQAVALGVRVGAEGHTAVARALLAEARILAGGPARVGLRPGGDGDDAEVEAIALEAEGLRLLPSAPEEAAEAFARAARRLGSLGRTAWLARSLALEAEARERAGDAGGAAGLRGAADRILDALATPAGPRARLLRPLRGSPLATGGSSAAPARGSGRRAGPAR